MENSIIAPAPPGMEGFIWRPITRDDLAAVVALAAKCHLADGGLAAMNEPGSLMSRYFQDGSGAAIGAFAANDLLIACTSVHLARESDAARAIIVGQVQPELRNRGIGTYLIRWSHVQAQALLTTPAVDKRLLQIATESLTESASHLYQAYGYESVFEELVMRRDLHLPLPDSPMPRDVIITSWQPTLANLYFRAYETSFRERPGFPSWSGDEWISWTADDDNFKPEWSLLAQASGEPLGFLTADSEHLSGFVVQIGVVPGHRRRGLGSALMVETMRRMQAAGAGSTQLTVNVNNPGAIQAYAKLGFATIGRRARYERIAER
jgi:mycothiol synthase